MNQTSLANTAAKTAREEDGKVYGMYQKADKQRDLAEEDAREAAPRWRTTTKCIRLAEEGNRKTRRDYDLIVRAIAGKPDCFDLVKKGRAQWDTSREAVREARTANSGANQARISAGRLSRTMLEKIFKLESLARQADEAADRTEDFAIEVERYEKAGKRDHARQNLVRARAHAALARKCREKADRASREFEKAKGGLEKALTDSVTAVETAEAALAKARQASADCRKLLDEARECE